MIRFSISMDEELARELDRLVAERGYASRSDAIRDMVRRELAEEALGGEGEASAVLITVFDHTRRDVPERVCKTYHRHHRVASTTLHIHLDERTCLEVTFLQGSAREVREAANEVLSDSGIVYGRLVPVCVKK